MNLNEHKIVLLSTFFALWGCGTNSLFKPDKRDCQRHWESYTSQRLGFKCDFGTPYRDLYENSAEPLRERLRILRRDRSKLCPYRTSLKTVDEIKRIKARIEVLNANKTKVRERDKRFETYRIVGTFGNWTEDESIFVRNSMVLKRDGGFFMDSPAVLVRDYPKIREWKIKGYVSEHGYRLGRGVEFENLYLIGIEKMFSPRLGYFLVPVYSFVMPQSKRRLWSSMLADLKDLDLEISALRNQMKSIELKTDEKCSVWFSLESGKLKRSIDALDVLKPCMEAKTAYYTYVLNTRYEGCILSEIF